MKAHLLLYLIIFSFNAFATEAQTTSALGTLAQVTVQDRTSIDAIDTFNSNYNILNSSQSIRFLKNPCVGKKGYHFNQFRGFAFENGIVKKFRLDGQLTYDRAASMHQFLTNRSVCKPASKNSPALNNLGIESLEIWN